MTRIDSHLLFTALEAAANAIVITDRKGDILWVNPAFTSLTGYTREEAIGRNPRVLKSGKHSPEFYADLWRTINAGSIWRGEMTNRRKDGSLYIEDMTITPVRDSGGEISGFIAIKQDVTVQKRAEETVRELQRQQRALLENIPDIAWVKDKERRYVAVNDAFSKAYGHAPEEIIGKTDLDFFPAELAESYRADDKHVMDSRKRKHVEEPFEDAAGDRTWIDTIKSPIVDDLGEVVGTAGIARDITERKQAEEALRASEERFRIAAETANDVVYEWDLKQSVEWLGKIDDMLGYEPGEFPRTLNGWAASVHPEDLERTMAAIQAHLEGRAPYAIEYRVRRKDGVYRWWSARGAVARTPDGKPTRWIGSITDITERKQAEERLTQERDLSEAILNNMPGLFYLITEKGRFLRWNRQFETVSGYSGEEIARMHPLDIFPAEHKGLVAEQILQVFKTGRGKVEANLLTKQGEQLPFYFTGGTVIVDGQPCLAGTGIDITERKRAEEEICKLNAELEQRVQERTAELSAINKELETFSYSVSHDLRAPLRGIDGFSKLLVEDYGDKLDDTAKDYLQRIRAAAQRMAKLIDDMLGLSGITRTELNHEPVNLSELARAVGAELQRREPDRQVELLIADGLAAEGDWQLLRVALENLLGNAWKFTGKTPQARVEFGATQQDGATAYFVRDNGAGFDMQYAHNLFGAFQRLHGVREFEGTGIGLATVQRIIHRHGGRVWAEGEVNKGATFYFTL